MDCGLQIPPLPTRQELADYCNALWPERKHPITVKIVRRWEAERWIHRHPAHRLPVRYSAPEVVAFLAGKF